MIYFIRAGETDTVKIGFAKNVANRLAQLQVGHADPLRVIREIEGDRSAERWLHHTYAERRLSGEWFRYCETMMTVVPPTFVYREVESRRPARQAVKRRLHAAVRGALPPGKVSSKEIASKVGCSPDTVDNYRRGVIPSTAAEMILYCQQYPAFRHSVAMMIIEGMDRVALERAILDEVGNQDPSKLQKLLALKNMVNGGGK